MSTTAPEGCLEQRVAGETLVLDPDRAVYWPARRTLLLADTHFGKGAAFRRQGLALPSGAAVADLARVAALIARHGAERLVVLGDFFHAAPDPGEPFFAAFQRWRAAHRGLAIEVVRGNHDRHAATVLVDALLWHEDPPAEDPFVLSHEPAPNPAGYVLAGHLHPVMRLRGPAGDRARLPAFHFGARVGVLPAFGSLTGGHPIRPGRGERVFVTGGGRVFALPEQQGNSQ